MEVAAKIVDRILDNYKHNEAFAMHRVQEYVKDVRFGKSGYFFVYTTLGINIADALKPEIAGSNSWNRANSDGV